MLKNITKVHTGAETLSDILSGDSSVERVGPRGRVSISFNGNVVTTVGTCYGSQSGVIVIPDGGAVNVYSTTAGANGSTANTFVYNAAGLTVGERIIFDVTVAAASTTQISVQTN